MVKVIFSELDQTGHPTIELMGKPVSFGRLEPTMRFYIGFCHSQIVLSSNIGGDLDKFFHMKVLFVVSSALFTELKTDSV